MELKKDLLHVYYDPAQVGQEQMLQAIDKQAFTGKVVAAEAGNPAP